MSEVIDFSQIEPAQEVKFLEPGMYRLKVDKDNIKVETPANKTPFLQVRFVGENGASLTEKFFLTPKAMPRFAYLHEAWFGKKLTEKFTSMVDVGKYFLAALTSKIVTRPMITGGKQTADGKFYSGLPYTGFIVADENLFEEGAFEKDSARYKQVVQVEKPNLALMNSDAAILPSTDVTNISSPWDV
jgi:hypothetical protein